MNVRKPVYCCLIIIALFPQLTKAKNRLVNDFSAKVVNVIDGDTIEVLKNGQSFTVRLAWIDCPEMKQDYGLEAKQFTRKRAFHKIVKVKVINIDFYGRLVGEVILSESKSLNKELLKAGLAWWYQRYSDDESLGRLERKAKKAKLGLWKRKNPVAPWEFRQ